MFHKHTCIYRPDQSGKKQSRRGTQKKDKIPRLQEMELCEILEQKCSLDCRGNLGHEQC